MPYHTCCKPAKNKGLKLRLLGRVKNMRKSWAIHAQELDDLCARVRQLLRMNIKIPSLFIIC